MAGFTNDIKEFFNFGNKRESLRESKLNLNSSFVKYYLDHENIPLALRIVNKVVESQEWLFGGEEGDSFYQNQSLTEAIRLGIEIRRLQGYMNNKEGYRGVDLNDDVLKMLLSDFLNEIDHYLFYAFSGEPKIIYEKVKNTPEEILKYVIEERYTKLLELYNGEYEQPDLDFSNRIFEYDLLLQKSGEEDSEDQKAVDYFSKKFSEIVMGYHVEKFDHIQEQEWRFEEEKTADTFEEFSEDEPKTDETVKFDGPVGDDIEKEK